MGRVDYDRSKLLMAAALGAAGALLFIFVMINPEVFASSRKGRWLTSGFGLHVIVPMMTAACLLLVWRVGSLACGNLLAIEFTPTHLKLNGYWGLKLVRWVDVASASIEANMNQPQLCVATRSGGPFGGKKIRLPLGLTNISPAQLGSLVAAIEQGVGPTPSAPSEEEDVSSTFDADAAIARYLERKLKDDGAGPLPAGGGLTRRPVFGRKQA